MNTNDLFVVYVKTDGYCSTPERDKVFTTEKEANEFKDEMEKKTKIKYTIGTLEEFIVNYGDERFYDGMDAYAESANV